MQPKISIIVPVYNGEKYISAFIRCIEKQHYDNIEVILVDDGSTDKTRDMCLEHVAKDERIVCYSKENAGPSSARNYGIKKATGDYVVFFDIDDEFSDSILSDNIKVATKNDSDVVMWNFKMVCQGIGKEFVRKIGESFNGNSKEFFDRFLIPVLDNEMFNPPWNKMIKRSLLIDNNISFDENYSIYEDILFSYNIMQKAGKISVNDGIYYDYIIKESGSLLTKFHEECFSAITAIYNAAVEYGGQFQDNSAQMDRFKRQMIHLTKGYIKQICVNKKLTLCEKKKYLSEIACNQVYMELSARYDDEVRASVAKAFLRHRLYVLLICFYNILDFFR